MSQRTFQIHTALLRRVSNDPDRITTTKHRDRSNTALHAALQNNVGIIYDLHSRTITACQCIISMMLSRKETAHLIPGVDAAILMNALGQVSQDREGVSFDEQIQQGNMKWREILCFINDDMVEPLSAINIMN
ncbi:hypothetical protein D1872_259720 [compost metagenome]